LGSLEVITKGPPVFKSPKYRGGAMKLAAVGHVPIFTIQYHDCISNHRSFSSLDCVLFFGYLVCYIPLRIRHHCTHNTLTTRAPLVLLSSPFKILYHGRLSDGTKLDKLRWLRLCDAAVQSDMAILPTVPYPRTSIQVYKILAVPRRIPELFVNSHHQIHPLRFDQRNQLSHSSPHPLPTQTSASPFDAPPAAQPSTFLQKLPNNLSPANDRPQHLAQPRRG